MKPSALTQRALALLHKAHKHDDLLIVHAEAFGDTATGETLHAFLAVPAADPNGPSYSIVLAEDGTPRESPAGHAPLARAFEPVHIQAAALAPITIQPDSNVLTLNPADTFDETITITVPKNAGAAKADIYFLADTTGSMVPVLAAVKAGASNVLSALAGLGLDLAFGVGNYKDFPPAAPSPFTHQLNPVNVAASVTAAIDTWTAIGGGDLPEGQLLALEQLAQAPGGSIGWRAGAKRIIVWIGDAPGHDPICTAISGLGSAITELSATAALVAQQIVVLAISTATPGLDADPTVGAGGYTPACGAAGGSAGQGTRLAAATGGTFVTGINPTTIVNTIINLVTGAVASINNLTLVPSAAIAPFITSIAPATGHGPLGSATQHVLTFNVKFHGIACADTDQVFTGTLDAVADGAVVVAKTVKITVPACRPTTVRYSVKFVCGTQPESCGCSPVRPGRYATQISIHNYSNDGVAVRKRFIPLVLAGAALGREPKIGTSRAEDSITLPAHTATMDDCCRITELVFGAPVDALTIGIMEIIVPRDVSVCAIYTTDESIDVLHVEGQLV